MSGKRLTKLRNEFTKMYGSNERDSELYKYHWRKFKNDYKRNN